MNFRFENISLSFGDKALVRDASFTIPGSSFVLITGPSGSGKSSFLRLLNRLHEPSSGSIFLDDRPLRDMEITQLRRQIALVPQTPVMLAGSVRMNLLFPFAYRSAASTATPPDSQLNAHMAEMLLDGVTLEDSATELSVGQKQRISLIRTLLGEPSVLLVDEPTSALDPDSKQVVERALLSQNRDKGTTIVMVTHSTTDIDAADLKRLELNRGEFSEKSK